MRLLLIKNEKNRKKQAEYLVGLANIVSIGDKQMQEGGYFQNDKGDFWLVYETRPYKGVPVRDYKKTKNILMGTPARKSVKRVRKNLSSFYYFLVKSDNVNREHRSKLINYAVNHLQQTILKFLMQKP